MVGVLAVVLSAAWAKMPKMPAPQPVAAPISKREAP